MMLMMLLILAASLLPLMGWDPAADADDAHDAVFWPPAFPKWTGTLRLMLMMLLFLAACFPSWAGTLQLMLMMLMMLACGRLLSPMGRDPLADAHDAHDAVVYGSLLPPLGRDPLADAHDAHDAGLWAPAFPNRPGPSG